VVVSRSFIFSGLFSRYAAGLLRASTHSGCVAVIVYSLNKNTFTEIFCEEYQKNNLIKLSTRSLISHSQIMHKYVVMLLYLGGKQIIYN